MFFQLVVANQSQITLKCQSHRGYLHSHNWTYPRQYPDGRISSAGQQVTMYPVRDPNNDWIAHIYERQTVVNEKDPSIRNGDVLQLEHVLTKRFLSTHDVASPSNPANMEVTLSHKNDNSTFWRLEMINHPKGSQWTILSPGFRLISVVHKVALHGQGTVLPAWAYNQLEVNGHKNLHQKGNEWVVDDNQNDQVSPAFREASKSLLKFPTFWQKFWELQKVMHRINANLNDNSHPFSSRPSDWPIVRRGISYWSESNLKKIYFHANPLIWWTALGSTSILLGLLVLDGILVKRGQSGFFESKEQREIFLVSSYFFGLGYVLHYLPFFAMSRVLFAHHYLPALLFSFLLSGVLVDMIRIGISRFLKSFSSRRRNSLSNVSDIIVYSFVILLIAKLAYEFIRYAPLSYGLSTTKEHLLSIKRARLWDFVLE